MHQLASLFHLLGTSPSRSKKRLGQLLLCFPEQHTTVPMKKSGTKPAAQDERSVSQTFVRALSVQQLIKGEQSRGMNQGNLQWLHYHVEDPHIGQQLIEARWSLRRGVYRRFSCHLVWCPCGMSSSSLQPLLCDSGGRRGLRIGEAGNEVGGRSPHQREEGRRAGGGQRE